MGQTILLIDDSAILRRIAANVLGARSVRYDVVTATRATEGFASACGSKPNLILVDARLAGTAKAELCQRFLAEPRTASVPVVLLLGRSATSPAYHELPDNVVDSLSKPFTPEQLMACVQSVLAAARAGETFGSIRTQLHGTPAETAVLVDRQTVTAAACHDTKKINRDRLDAISTAALSTGDRGRAPGPSAAPRGPAEGSLRNEFFKIAEEKLSGVYSVMLADRPLLDIYFESGRLVVVTTRDAIAYSRGAHDVLPPKVSPATLEMAVDEQRQSGVPFFLTLGARGLLSKAAAVDLLHRFGQQYFSRVWQVQPSKLRGEFTPLDALPGFALRLDARREPLDEWLLGTLRVLRTEDLAAASKHDGFVGTPSLSRQGQNMISALKLTEEEKQFIHCVTARLDLPAIAKALKIPPEGAYLLLYRFRAMDMMNYRPAPAAYVVTPRTNVRRVLPLRR